MKQTRPYYLDAAATTRVDARVADLVVHYMREEFGNAGSRTHAYGVEAKRAVVKAREQLAAPFAAQSDDVIFTSGATESNNIALLGLARFGCETGRRHIIASAIEHKAVLEPLEYLAGEGFDVTLIAPDRAGHVDPGEFVAAVRADTLLVSLMHANNETGAMQPIGQVADALGETPVFFHVDAAQSFGKATPELRHPRIDMIAISGHKVHAPKGVGALVARRRGATRPPLAPLMYGGGQERGLRPGTLPVPLIVGLGLASELAEREREVRVERLRAIRAEGLAALGPLIERVHGDPAKTLPNILSVALRGLDSEAAMLAFQDVASASNGSACTSASYSPSHVLTAMGLPFEQVQNSVRFSFAHDDEVPWRDLSEALALFV
ncbi:cysteine desulfurase DndA [Sphingopyxis panaciterrae]